MQDDRFRGHRRGRRGWIAAIALTAALALPAAAQADRFGPELALATGPTAAQLRSDGLPAVLDPADAELYREIFALQEQGEWPAADKRIARLSDRRLMGHVMAQRYLHPTAYRSKYKELRDWMAHYADHPQAQRIYKLALKRRPKNYKHPKRPEVQRSSLATPIFIGQEPYRSTKRLSRSERRQAAKLKRQVRRNVLRTRLTITEKLLAGAKAQRLLDRVELDDAYTEVAAAWFYYGNDARAYGLADAAAGRSGEQVILAHWIAGLAAWRMGRVAESSKHFEALANSATASGWNVASGAYWAARAHLRLKRPAEMSRWLAVAAKYPRTFYGLLAQRALGMKLRFELRNHPLTPDHVARLAADITSARALALLQVGERRLAERELRGMNGSIDVAMTRALLALTEHARLPELAFRLGNRLASLEQSQDADGLLDAALYPLPPWQPKSGFTVDRALIYAMMRQESGFNTFARSPDGARGLMQLMPRTASFIARDRGYRRGKRKQLFDPATNLELGQRYIAHLLEHNLVRGDLFRLTTAYNGGPGNLNKWLRKMDYKDDPLLFIESLPSRETRLFIERVLTNLWIYRARLGQPAPSLDGIASGDWPLYVALDRRPQELARNANEPN